MDAGTLDPLVVRALLEAMRAELETAKRAATNAALTEPERIRAGGSWTAWGRAVALVEGAAGATR